MTVDPDASRHRVGAGVGPACRVRVDATTLPSTDWCASRTADDHAGGVDAVTWPADHRPRPLPPDESALTKIAQSRCRSTPSISVRSTVTSKNTSPALRAAGRIRVMRRSRTRRRSTRRRRRRRGRRADVVRSAATHGTCGRRRVLPAVRQRRRPAGCSSDPGQRSASVRPALRRDAAVGGSRGTRCRCLATPVAARADQPVVDDGRRQRVVVQGGSSDDTATSAGCADRRQSLCPTPSTALTTGICDGADVEDARVAGRSSATGPAGRRRSGRRRRPEPSAGAWSWAQRRSRATRRIGVRSSSVRRFCLEAQPDDRRRRQSGRRSTRALEALDGSRWGCR